MKNVGFIGDAIFLSILVDAAIRATHSIRPSKLPLSKRIAKLGEMQKLLNEACPSIEVFAKGTRRCLLNTKRLPKNGEGTFYWQNCIKQQVSLTKVPFYHNGRIMRLAKNICETIFHFY